MSSMTDETLALADVYAEALLRAAAAQGQDEEVASELADLVAYMDKNPRFDGFLTSPTVDDEARRDSLEKLFRGRMNDLLLNLLQVLNARRRSELIRAVARRVELRMEEKHHQTEVIVETPVPLSDRSRELLKSTLQSRLNKEPLLIEQVRPELIGGLVLRVGDMQLDASLVTRLQTLRGRLQDRATREIHRDGHYVQD